MELRRTANWLGALQALLPPGQALSREPAANVTKLLEGAAAMLGDAEQSFDEWAAQYDPAVATTMLDDWERLLGLPDCCDAGVVRSTAQRRIDVLEKLTVLGGQSRQYFIDLLARRGVTITIDELGHHVWRVNTAMVNLVEFCAGTAVAGDPLRQWGSVPMECRITRLKPAHTRTLFGYVEAPGREINIDFTAGQSSPLITSSGGANRTRVDRFGVTVAASAPRIDFNQATLACRGLLSEPPQQQLLRYSNDLTNAVWVKRNVVTPDVDRLVETTANDYHQLYQSVASAAVPHAMYFEVKPAGRTVLVAQVSDGVSNAMQVQFDLSGAGGYSALLAFGTASGVAASIRALGDGYYACLLVGTPFSSGTVTLYGLYLTNATLVYVGDGVSGVQVRNSMLVQGAFATSPIPTGAAALAASAETHFVSGANFSNWYNAEASTFALEFTPYALSANDVFWGIGQTGAFANSMYLINSAGSLYLIVYRAGVNTAALNLGALAAGTAYKVAISMQAGEIAARCNGGAERLSTGALPAVVDNMALLCTPWNGGSSYPAARMARLRYWPRNRRADLLLLSQ